MAVSPKIHALNYHHVIAKKHGIFLGILTISETTYSLSNLETVNNIELSTDKKPKTVMTDNIANHRTMNHIWKFSKSKLRDDVGS